MVGPTVRRLRNAAELSQADLAARCGVLGWDLSRETLAKIESQIRWVADFELMCLAAALRVEVKTLLPSPIKSRCSFAEWFEG
ncbi:MAG: helix-turn-helix transcriptional regulator [Fimbriimonadaceae bacterium]